MDAVKSSKMNSTTIKWIITLAVTAVLLLLPEVGILTMKVKLFLAITTFCIMLTAFELMPVVFVGFLMPALYVLLGVSTIKTVMSPWVSTTLYMIVGGYALAAVLDASGILKRISYWILSKTGKSWYLLLFVIFIAGVVLTIVTFARGYIILAAMCVGLCKSMDIMGTKRAVAICWACMLGTCSAKCFTYCVSAYAVVINAAQSIIPNHSITFNTAILSNWPMALVSIVILLVIGKWYKGEGDLNSKDYFVEQLRALPALSYREKSAAVTLVILFALLVTEEIHGISNAMVFMVVPWLAMLPIFGQDIEEVLKGINFKIIFFVEACLAIGAVGQEMGFGDLITQYAVPFFQSTGNNYFVIFGVIFGIVFALNFLMTPMAIWALVTAPLIQVAMALGINPDAVIFSLIHCAEAIIMPYEYTPYLIVYAFGMISMKDFIKTSVVKCLIYFPGFLFVLVPYWMLIGLL